MLEGNTTVRWFKETARSMLPRGRFARSIAILTSGTVLGQCIIILASPILTRLYGPNDFGVMAVYVSLLSILSVVASLRYELAIPLSNDDKEEANLLALSLALVLIVGLLTCIAVGLFGNQLINWINTPALHTYLWLLPLGIVFAGTYKVFNYWAIRRRAFSLIAQTKVNQGLGLVTIQIALGILNFGPIGLLLGHIVGQSAGITTLASLAWGEKSKFLKTINLTSVITTAVKYKNFPLFSTWSGVLNTLSVHVPTLMLAFFFGPEITGLYALSHRLMSLPMQLVGQTIAQVFFPDAVEATRKGSLASTTELIFKQLVLLGVPAFLLFGLAAPEFFSVIFGGEWRESGIYAQFLSPWIVLVFISSPLSILPSILGKQRQEVIFQMLLFASRVGALYIGGSLNNPRAAMGLFAGVSAIFWFGFMLWNMGLSGHNVIHILKILFDNMIRAALFILPLVIIKISIKSNIHVVVAAMLCSLLFIYQMFHKRKLQDFHDH